MVRGGTSVALPAPLLALWIALTVVLCGAVADEHAAMRKAEALASASFEREHRLVVESGKLRASAAAMSLSCRDTGDALAECTARLAACWRHEGRGP